MKKISLKKKVVVIITFVATLVLVIHHYSIHERVRTKRVLQMQWIDLSIQNYINANRKFPHHIFVSPKDNIHCSWRFCSGIYMSYGRGFREEDRQPFDFEKSWNEEPNISFWAPAYNWTGRPKSPKDHKRYWTNVMAITGPDTAFEVQELNQLQGCDHLIIVVEVANSGIHWGEPGDIDVNNLPENLTSGIDGNGFMALFFDGSVWFIKKDVPIEILQNFLTITNAKKHDRNKELKPYAIVYHESERR